MTDLVAEFSSWNNIELRQAFTQACRYISEQNSVSVVDVRHARPDVRADLAVFTADVESIFQEPCSSSLQELSVRQLNDIRLALGIAATGASGAQALDLAASLGPQPPGAIREVVAANGVAELYQHIVRWLEAVIADQPYSAVEYSLAHETAEALDANLPTSHVGPATTPKLRSKP